MNHFFGTVWNKITRSHGKASSERCVDGAVASKGLQRPRPMPLVLEARLMFDGAAVDTALHAATDAQSGVPDAPAIEQGVAEPTLVPSAVEVAPTTQRTEIVFIENNIVDYQTLLNSIKPGAEVHVLDATQDGLAQMAQILAGRSGIDAIHVISHGSQAAIDLGSLSLTSDTLDAHASEIANIGHALSADGDILLYGCNVSAGADGAEFIARLAELSRADVAASTDLTGAVAKGGNWTLERASGVVDTAAVVGVDYSDILPLRRVPTLYSATYAQASGLLTIAGGSGVSSYFLTGDTLHPNLLTIKGEGGSTYVLTSSNVSVSSGYQASFTLNTADRLAVNGLLNKNGTSAVGSTVYNIAGATNWLTTTSIYTFPGYPTFSSDSTCPVTVSNITSPTITSAAYDGSSHILTVTAVNMVGMIGASNDITTSKLTLTGEGGASYTLTSGDVDVLSKAQFSVTLNSTDQAGVAALFTLSGTTSVDSTTYNLAAADDWNSVINDTDIADATSAVTVSNMGPSTNFSGLSFSADTGTSSSDFITKTAAQTITATLSAALLGGESAYGSLDNGSTWTDITNKVSGTSLSWDSVTLGSSDTLKLKVTNTVGDGRVKSQAYTLDTTAPTVAIVMDDAALKMGETSLVTFTFSEAVTGFDGTDLTLGNGTLTTLNSGDGGINWTATLTPMRD
ncbi:MAG: DUF4347 domain-containing protein, partial [Burkholderiaceae bacterium]|nr:DUF4347 domain-containing protein [Burkholderiaceae bacterium]